MTNPGDRRFPNTFCRHLINREISVDGIIQLLFLGFPFEKLPEEVRLVINDTKVRIQCYIDECNLLLFAISGCHHACVALVACSRYDVRVFASDFSSVDGYIATVVYKCKSAKELCLE